MANFNGFDDVRSWLTQSDMTQLRARVSSGEFAGKTLEVARAYIAHVDEHGYDLTESDDDEEDDDPKWTWNVWRIAIVAAFLIGPALLVWALNSWAR